jgi:CIC family chloride channel protein
VPSSVQSSQPLGKRIPAFFTGLLDRVQPPEEAVLVTTALLVGLTTGLGAVAFRYLIQAVAWLGYNWVPQVLSAWGRLYAVIVPTVGGLLVGLLVYFFAREAKGHGVPEVMEAVALRGGRIRPIVALVKSLASALCIGSGGSVGREGPIVQIGSALGSTLGQMLRLSDERARNLVACGAAGGIAATFNAPIAGVMFALEIISGEFSVANFSTVVISSVAASVVGRAVFGNAPAFPVPTQYHINSVWEFALYPILGVLAAVVGVVFVRALYWSEDLFDGWKGVPEWVKPAVGGALLGGMALGYPLVTGITWEVQPQVYNVGYDVIGSTLSNHLALNVVLGLLILKLLATVLTLGSGGSGGIFAPSLFMGAMLGTAFGIVVNLLFPGLPAPPGAYALVGMAATFAASAHAPITAIIILFELTGDYRIILPLMLTVVVATLLAQWWLKGESIYTLKLTRRGVRLERGRDVDVMQSVTVGEAMTREIDTVSASMTLRDLGEAFARTRHHGFPVLDDGGKLWGMVTLQDVERAIDRHLPDKTTVAEIGTQAVIVAYPDEPMGVALRRLSTRGVGRLPVVSRDDPRHLVGLVRRHDIVRAYNVALTRRAEIQHRTKHMRLRNLDNTEFVEIKLKEGDPAVGKTLDEIARLLPDDCILVSIRRNNRLLIPHGNTRLEAGDLITAFVTTDAVESLHHCLHD